MGILSAALVVLLSFQESAEDLHQSGLAKFRSGDYKGAIEDLSRAIALEPANPSLYNNRGAAWGRKGDRDSALGDYTKAIGLSPKFALAYRNRAAILRDLGRLDEALADFDKVIELEPDAAAGYLQRGRVRVRKETFDGARADFTKVLTINSKDTAALADRGHLAVVTGDFDRAVEDCSAGLEITPAYVYLLSLRGTAQYGRQSWAEALKDFEAALAGGYSGSYAPIMIWCARARAGDRKAADEGLVAHLKALPADRAPDGANAWHEKIASFLAGEFTQAGLLRLAESKDADRKSEEKKCEAEFFIATWHLLAGDKAAAREHFTKCVNTGVRRYTDYALAKVELKGLEE